MSKLANQWIEIFRAGDYGDQGLYTERDLDQVAADYLPTQHEAPVVVGHPENDAPAFAWVEGVKRQGSTLLAKLRQVQPEFEQAVESGKFKKRSVAFYRNGEGKLSLRHVGFLGAKPPQIKGLADVRFSDGSNQVITLSFQEDSQMDETNLFDRLTAWLSEKFPQQKIFSEAEVKKAAGDAAKAVLTEAVKSFRAEIDALKTPSGAPAAAFAEGGAAAVEKRNLAGAAATTAIDQIKQAGRWLPAFDKMGVPLLFAELARSGTEATIEFGEGEQKKKMPALDLLKDVFTKLPAFVPRGHVWDAGKRSEFAEPGQRSMINAGRSVVDSNSDQLNTLAKQRASEKRLSFSEALTEVASENPTLTQPGAAAGGQV